MQRVLQCLVSCGYQCAFRLLNAGNYATGQVGRIMRGHAVCVHAVLHALHAASLLLRAHKLELTRPVACCIRVPQYRRRVIIIAARFGLPMPCFPEASHVFPGAGGYDAATGTWSRKERLKQAWSGVPKHWRGNAVVPLAAPLPAIVARDVLWDLPFVAGRDATTHRCDPTSYYAAAARGWGQQGEGAAAVQLANHVFPELGPITLERVAAIPKQPQEQQQQPMDEDVLAVPAPPRKPGAACSVAEHPSRPARAGNWCAIACLSRVCKPATDPAPAPVYQAK